jgi:hypothetical protein
MAQKRKLKKKKEKGKKKEKKRKERKKRKRTEKKCETSELQISCSSCPENHVRSELDHPSELVYRLNSEPSIGTGLSHSRRPTAP